MCRPKELGGRRCPQHTDPIKHAAYNARRRELYAATKAGSSLQVSTPLAANFFAPIHDEDGSSSSTHTAEAEEYRKIINPDYNPNTWGQHLITDLVWETDQNEVDALLGYTMDNFVTIGNYLNGNLDEDEEEWEYTGKSPEWIDRTTSLIDSAISKAVPPENPRTLYRGVDITAGFETDEAKKAWVAEHFPLGGVISQKNYMSTSMNMSTAAQFMDVSLGDRGRAAIFLELTSRKGAVLGEGVHALGNEEQEVLVGREERFKITGVHHDVFMEDGVDKVCVIQITDADD